MAKNGMTPFITLSTFSLDIALTTKRFSPTGGVIIPSSMFTTMIIAKWITLISSVVMIGRRIGRVIKIIAVGSKNIPRMKNKTLTIIKNVHLLKPLSLTHDANP